MKKGASEAFLDTSFLLPFLQVDVNVKGFSVEQFESYVADIDKIHFSEVSVMEAKAKLLKLAAFDESYRAPLDHFGENLAVLQNDDKICFHIYDIAADRIFNRLHERRLSVDLLDAFIISEAVSVGLLITEDEKILKLREEEAFTSDPVFGGLRLNRWKETQRI